MYNVFRVAALAPCFRHSILSDSMLDMNGGDSRVTALANLVLYIPKQLTFKNGDIPLRWVL